MKRSQSLILATVLSSMIGLSNLAFAADDSTQQTKGKVQRVLMNPEGKIDGLLLVDGTQVKFPPHMSQELLSLVKANDSISIKGTKENAKVIKAESITNTATNKSIVDKGPTPPEGGSGEGPGGPGPKLLGRKGEVNGAILADGSIVRFSPRIVEDSKVKVDVGQNLKVTGFGTQNSNGKSLEATSLSNN
ncbi:MAG: hypothetical protein EOP07_08240 [Proteobacteria bacterium]|nr:MAG: hypothetical protein EOP07_08240 [Pseudomonadota bacterium]